MILDIIGQALQVFVPCYFGSILLEATKQLSLDMYNSQWPDQSTKFKLSMLILSERLSKPVTLYANKKVISISLPTFVSVSFGVINQLYVLNYSYLFIHLGNKNSFFIA